MREIGEVRVLDQAVADADVGRQAVEHLAAAGGLDPERQLGDLDALGVHVHPEKVVGEDLAVGVEKVVDVAPPAFELGDLVVDPGELGLEEVEGHDQEDARPAGRIDDPQRSQPLTIGPPGLHFGRLPTPLDRGIVAEGRARLGMIADDAGEGFRQMRAERLGHDEAGDVVGRIDHPVPLAPPAGSGRLLGRLVLAPRLRLQPFDVGDRLLEDVAEDGDGDLRGEVVAADRMEAFADGIRQAQPVDRGIGLEQAAIVARDPQRLAALVDRLEQADEIVPDRARVVRVPGLEGVAEGVARQEPGVLGEGDEEHAVEDLLRGGDPGQSVYSYETSHTKRLLSADCVEKLRLLRGLIVDSIIMRPVESAGDDGTEAGGAGRAILRILARTARPRGSPAEVDRPVRRAWGRSRASGASLQLDRPAVGRSGADDPDAARGLLLRDPLGAAAVRGGPPQPRLQVVLPARPGGSGPGPLDLLQEPARTVPRLRPAPPRLRGDSAPVHRGGARRRRAFRRRRQPDRGGREQAALDRPRGLGPGGDRSRHGAARGPGVPRGSRRRGLRRGEPGRAEVHLARRSRGAMDRSPEGPRLLRLCDQLPRRHRQRDHRRRRDDARHPPGGGRRRAHHDRPHDGPLRPLPRAADRRQRLRLRADAGLARRGARDRAAHPRIRQVGPSDGHISAPTSPTTTATTSTSVRRARRSGSSTGRPAPTARRAVVSMPRA